MDDLASIERELTASRARYESLYQEAPDMFASVRVDDTRLAQCNRTLVRAVGYARDELLGRTMRELHARPCWPALDTALQRVARDGEVRDVELALRRRDGSELAVSLSMAAIRDEKDNLYYRSTWRDITERIRARDVLERQQAELAQSRRELRGLAGRLLTAQEDERRRISRELHDDLNQRLAMLTLDVESLRNELPDSRTRILGRLGRLRDDIVALSDAVHTLAYQLHASVLDDLGLVAALRAHVATVAEQERLEVTVEAPESVDGLPSDLSACLYRVAQEALRNAARHANAEHVTVELAAVADGLRLAVTDDGRGFDVRSSRDAGTHLGVVGMEERVRLVDGRFDLRSRPGQGTRVEAWVPRPTETRS